MAQTKAKAKARTQVDPRTVNLWTARVIPLVLMGVVGYATYVLVDVLCVEYLLRGPNPRPGVASGLLFIYFLLFLCMATAYLRVLYVVTFDPGFVPLGRAAGEKEHRGRQRGGRGARDGPARGAGGAYDATEPVAEWRAEGDAPGLEEFYSKDVFVCEQDGRPKWCSECGNWKPDRTHHCSDVNRCVRKMDHFCPWVGGVVAENSFKFFIQFVFYTCIYCLFLLIVMALYLHEQLNTPGITWDPDFAAILGLATFFGLFTFGMTCSSVHFAVANLTTIENLNKKTKAWQLAVFIPNPADPPRMGVSGIPYPTVTYPLPLIAEKSTPSSAPSDSTIGDVHPVDESRRTHEQRQSERDLKATRTFAILRMEPGRSPWDLGALGNWRSVMGNSILDWLLPVKRSPCCNHEGGVSQFALGAHFDGLRADHGLAPAGEVQRPRPFSGPPRRRPSRPRGRDVEMGKYGQPP